jgi:hypothetical protein
MYTDHISYNIPVFWTVGPLVIKYFITQIYPWYSMETSEMHFARSILYIAKTNKVVCLALKVEAPSLSRKTTLLIIWLQHLEFLAL